jgi:hypothetical protein
VRLSRAVVVVGEACALLTDRSSAINPSVNLAYFCDPKAGEPYKIQ